MVFEDNTNSCSIQFSSVAVRCTCNRLEYRICAVSMSDCCALDRRSDKAAAAAAAVSDDLDERLCICAELYPYSIVVSPRCIWLQRAQSPFTFHMSSV